MWYGSCIWGWRCGLFLLVFIKASRHGIFVVRVFLKLFWFEFSMSFLLPVFVVLVRFCFSKPYIKTLDTFIMAWPVCCRYCCCCCCCSLTEFNTTLIVPQGAIPLWRVHEQKNKTVKPYARFQSQGRVKKKWPTDVASLMLNIAYLVVEIIPRWLLAFADPGHRNDYEHIRHA